MKKKFNLRTLILLALFILSFQAFTSANSIDNTTSNNQTTTNFDISSFTLEAIFDANTYNAGSLLQTGVIGDKVWYDQNANDLQEPNELGLDGVVVRLYDCNDLNNPLETQFTNNGGKYEFNGLTAGDYVVQFGTVTGYNRSTQDVGNDDEIDSDAGTDGFTDCITLGADEVNNSVDAGYFLCNPNMTLSCNDNVTLALGPNCETQVLPGDLLEGENQCTGLYEVELFFDGESIGDVVTGEYIGETLIGIVSNPDNGNSCQTEITVQDNIAPIITSCGPLTVPCTGSIDPDVIGGITATDNCSDILTIDFSDIMEDGDCNDPYAKLITRTWVVTDQSGNTSTCVQQVTLMKPVLGDVIFPVDLDDVDAPSLDCNNPDTDPDNTGRPTIDGVELMNGDVCGIQLFYEDVQTNSCEGSFELKRTWTIIDDCTNADMEHIQFIEINDTNGPVLNLPNDISLNANTADCETDILLPSISFSDDCASPGSITVVTQTPVGTINGNGGWVFDIPTGNYQITYVATDPCGNSTEGSINLSIADNAPPVAICDEQTSVSIGVDGMATICWPTFDDGSYDNCGIVAYKVKRADDPDFVPFTDCVNFDCEDVGETVGVRLRVYDIAGTYTENDVVGRFNECTVQVQVQDNLGPVLSCPPNTTVGCWEDFSEIPELSDDPDAGAPVLRDGELIGYYAGAFDNCGIDSVFVSEQGGTDNCGEGQITRFWTAVDNNGETTSCVQILYIENGEPFDINDVTCNNEDPNDGVIWPCDYNTNECGALTDTDVTGAPEITEDACDLVGITFDDVEFPIQGNGCLKILRTWLVVDWCQPDNSPLGYKNWSYTQEIKVINSEAPQILSSCDDITICNFEDDCGPAPANLTILANDDCTDFGDLNFLYKIDLNSNGTDDFFGQSNDASDDYPNGVHTIFWKVEDGCGNITTCEYTFTVEDCANPTPICINGLTTTLNPTTGEVTLPATAFDSGDTYDNCTDYEDLQFSFSPDVTDEIMTFTCDQLDTNTIELWVTDEAGNQEVCQTYIIIQDPSNFCNPMTTTAGLIHTETYNPVAQVTVNINDDNGGNMFSQVTQLDGGYDFDLAANDNYSIEPKKNINPLNGVTTFDLVLIKQHILGVNPFSSPYKIIAADASKDGNITTFDIVELQKLILFLNSELSNNDSWRFVDKSYTFPNPTNPFFPPFPEAININNLSSEVLDNDFVAVKIGDVDDSAEGTELVDDNTADRATSGDILFDVTDRIVKEGEVFEVTFNASQFEQVKGYQFTLQFENEYVEFIDLTTENADLSLNNFGMTMLDEGTITANWIGEDVQEGDAMFTLQFQAFEEGRISDWLDLNSTYTKAEAYRYNADNNNFELNDVKIRFNANGETSLTGQTFELYQNQPNPFRETTTIAFNLPQSEEATLSIYDASGKVVKRIHQGFDKGYNAITINRSDLDANGILYYRLETAEHNATKKMILMN